MVVTRPLHQDPALSFLTADDMTGREVPEYGPGWHLLLQEALLSVPWLHPQTILETAQDILPEQRGEKTGLGSLSSEVLAGVTPGSDLDNLLVVCWIKHLLT